MRGTMYVTGIRQDSLRNASPHVHHHTATKLVDVCDATVSRVGGNKKEEEWPVNHCCGGTISHYSPSAWPLTYPSASLDPSRPGDEARRRDHCSSVKATRTTMTSRVCLIYPGPCLSRSFPTGPSPETTPPRPVTSDNE
jgi:hypothetical protein